MLSIIKAESVLSKRCKSHQIPIKTLAGPLEEARKQIQRFLKTEDQEQLKRLWECKAEPALSELTPRYTHS